MSLLENTMKYLDECNQRNKDFAEQYYADKKTINKLESRIKHLEAELKEADEEIKHLKWLIKGLEKERSFLYNDFEDYLEYAPFTKNHPNLEQLSRIIWGIARIPNITGDEI